jgi:hypothetical protein
LGSVGSEFAIAYSGGLASAFVAASAIRAGRRPLLLHADLEPVFHARSLATVPGLEIRRNPVDPFELLDHHPITGDEMLPPLPDIEVPRRMLARLAADSGVPIVSGGLLTTLTSVKLPDVQAGPRGWRLLGCQPFHISGTLRTLAEARELLGEGPEARASSTHRTHRGTKCGEHRMPSRSEPRRHPRQPAVPSCPV